MISSRTQCLRRGLKDFVDPREIASSFQLFFRRTRQMGSGADFQTVGKERYCL